MTAMISGRLGAGLGAAGLALALAGCQSGMTYGTGVSPGMQTLNDVAGIVEMGDSNKKKDIDYSPRPPIVEPPVATLPQPGPPSGAALAANWPNDPDAQAKRLRDEAEARGRDDSDPFGSKDPVFRLPQQEQTSDQPSPTLVRNGQSDYERAHSTPDQVAASKKLYADSRNATAVDENGLPIRRYLVEPKSEYRVPDPESEVEISAKTKKKRGWKWPDLWPFD
jgi:hypothetical protein